MSSTRRQTSLVSIRIKNERAHVFSPEFVILGLGVAPSILYDPPAVRKSFLLRDPANGGDVPDKSGHPRELPGVECGHHPS